MQLIRLPAEQHNWNEDKKRFDFVGDGLISILDLIWSGINKAQPEEKLTRKDHRTIKKVKAKIKDITRFKDFDKDSRIGHEYDQELILEDAELDMLKKLLESNKFLPIISDEVDLMWTIIDSAEDYVPPKPTLVSADPATK